MRKLLFLGLLVILGLAAGKPSMANDADSAFKQGVKAESNRDCLGAYEAYEKAYRLKPNEPKFAMSYLRARSCASSQAVERGIKLREESKLQEAAAEFQRAMEIDGTDVVASQELRRTAVMIQKQAEQANVKEPEASAVKPRRELDGPVELMPSPNTPISLRLTTTADNVYRTIGRLGGVNVLFDLDYKPQRISIELNEVSMREALRMVALESKTFWRPISPTAIFVAAESRRKDYEDNVMRTFYLRNSSTSGELQEVVGTLKGILDISRIQVNPTQNSITVRGTPDQLVLAEELISNVDKAKSEVMIDIAVMQISRDRIRDLGTNLPTSNTISFSAGSTVAGNLVKIGSLNGGSFAIQIPNVTVTTLMSDSKTKILQKPQLRAMDNEKATLKIGDRYPIAVGSFSPGTSGGVNALVNTQFQFIDIGVNIDITPHIHSDHEVTLKMVLEISAVTGSETIGGVTQPIIGQRRIEHETRLQDGELNLVGGILSDTETDSMSGYPWLTKIPILKYLFGQNSKERTESEIVFAIMPHIVRSQEYTDDNKRLIDLGSATSIGLRYREVNPVKTSPGTTPAPAENQALPNRRRQPAAPVANPPASAPPSPPAN